jgi:hypothetical protein
MAWRKPCGVTLLSISALEAALYTTLAMVLDASLVPELQEDLAERIHKIPHTLSEQL